MTDIIKEQFKLRIYTEGIARINKVLDMLSEEQVWYSPNANMNSVGNLVLHLNGNVTQWIGTGIAQHKDICLLYTSPSPRDRTRSRMPSSA